MINAETINLYWKIGEEIYRQQEENGGENLLCKNYQKSCRKNFQGQKVIQ